MNIVLDTKQFSRLYKVSFDVTKSIDFPSINCITLQEFQKLL